MMALNAKLKMNNDSRCRIENVALNTELKVWLWMPKWKCDFEHQTENVALNAKLKWTMTLNAKRKMALVIKLKTNNGSEIQNKDVALNTKMKIWLWNPNWKCDSKHQMKNGSRCRTKDKQRLWTPKWRCGFELQDEDVALNAKMKMQLWTPNWKKVWWLQMLN